MDWNRTLKTIRPFAMIAATTFVLILGSNLLSLGAFGVSSLFGIAALAIALTAGAYVAFYGVALAVCVPASIKQPGVLLQTLFGIISGSVAIWLAALISPSSVLLDGLFAAVPYATVNVLMIWAFAYSTGAVRKDLALLPKR